MTGQTIKRIPYGVADYRRIRTDNSYYVDKTHFIPLIEAAPYYLFFIRPRRFGKSLWLSVLQQYYDLNFKIVSGHLQRLGVGLSGRMAKRSRERCLRKLVKMKRGMKMSV